MLESSTCDKQRNITFHKGIVFFKVIAFFLILALLLPSISRCLMSYYNSRIHEFYKEKKDSLDVVFIGSSNTHAFWSPLYAWKNHGIATANYSADSQQILTFRYMIEEVTKYQPHAVIAVTLTSLTILPDMEYLHRLTDVMPWSLTKIRLIHDYCKREGLTLEERFEYYFTFFRFHSRWDSLTSADFKKLDSAIPKSPFIWSTYFQVITDISSEYKVSNDRLPLQDDYLVILNDILDYCEENKISVIFLKAPQGGASEEKIAILNTAYDLIESRGFPTLNMQSMTQDIGLDLKNDFYNNNHTNIHGSLKYTDYVADYLIKQYGLKDHRNESDYQEFNDAFDAYSLKTAPYLFPFEDGGAPRDYMLSAPEGLNVQFSDQKNVAYLSWKEVSQSIDGYAIFRKRSDGNNNWEEIGSVESSVNSLSDGDLMAGKSYYYTVVPYIKDNGIRTYGNLNYQGVKVTVPDS